MKLFNKKDIARDMVEEKKESTHQNNSTFKNNMKVEGLNNARILELQQKYRNGDINLRELTNEEIDKLSELYDEQISELQKKIESKRNIIEEYKKNKPYRIKRNNV